MAVLGVDTGGTFTDFVLYDKNQLTVHKVLSTPDAPERAILQGMKDLQLDLTSLKVIHGSTVATNAVLEAKGARTLYITNYGLKDVLLIGRQARRELYNLQPEKPLNPVEKSLCLETGGRLSATGEMVEPLTRAELDQLMTEITLLKPDAVAINLLFSFLNPQIEKDIAAAIRKSFGNTIYISRSSSVLPEYKEYERGMTTWLNAYVGPLVQHYLNRLAEKISPANLSIMLSAGGTANAEQAGLRAAHMLLSGPAGGLQAARSIGKVLSEEKLLTFDMGGTSTDVALIDGDIQLSNDAYIAGLPVALPMVDMHTIGAGGGSIAWIDDGNLLQVGPASAGAFPGPACYGKGGVLPTVTDANLVLGRIPEDATLGGHLLLDLAAAYSAIKNIADRLNCSVIDAAEGILLIANEHMVQALRVISVQKGLDPRIYTLVSFGGAGGLHVCDLAKALDVKKAIVPAHSGVLSAFGMLVAPISRELSQTNIALLCEKTDKALFFEYEKLSIKGYKEMLQEGVVADLIEETQSIDLRYRGQSFCLNVLWQGIGQTISAFHETHLQRYGHKLDEAVEMVNIRLSLKTQTPSLKLKQALDIKEYKVKNQAKVQGFDEMVPVIERNAMAMGKCTVGPLLIIEDVATTFIKSGWQCQVMAHGHLLLKMTNNH